MTPVPVIDEMRKWETIPARLRDWVERTPDRAFLRGGERWLSFAEVDAKSLALAGGLMRLGLAKGDVVGAILTNREEMLLLMFACFRAGLVFVPFNAFLRGDFLRYQLADSRARILVLDAPGLAEVAKIDPAANGFDALVSVDDADLALDARLRAKLRGFSTLLDGAARTSEPRIEPADIAAVFYTSGTTGMPKGCMVSHGYAMTSAIRWFEHGLAEPGDVVLSPQPLFHAGAGMCLVMMTLQGGSAACFDPSFSARGFLPRAKEVGATIGSLPGPIAVAMLSTPEGPADRDHPMTRIHAVPMRPELRERFEARFGIKAFSRAYGQSESVPSALGRWTADRKEAATAGEPVADVDVRIVGDDDEELPRGAVGEIVVRPRRPNAIFSGYWRKPEETVRAFRNLWHHTGDLGLLTEAGLLKFVDRKKDSLRRHGENVSAFELEQVLLGHPAIAAAAAVAVVSDLGEDEIKLYLVVNGGAEIAPAELFALLRERVPYFAIPRYVDVVPSLPLNAMGRVMKSTLRERGIGGGWDFDALGLVVKREERRG